MAEYTKTLESLLAKQNILERRLKKLRGVIKGLEDLEREEGPGASLTVLTPSLGTGLPYRGMTVRAAARKCLEMNRQPMNAHEIAAELRDGGMETEAKKFTTTVYSILFRASDEFESEGGKWSLCEWKKAK